MNFVEPRPFADPEVAARKLMEIANSIEPVQDGRIYIEKINWPFVSELKGTPAGTYDYVACWSGTVSEMKLSGGASRDLSSSLGWCRNEAIAPTAPGDHAA